MLNPGVSSKAHSCLVLIASPSQLRLAPQSVSAVVSLPLDMFHVPTEQDLLSEISFGLHAHHTPLTRLPSLFCIGPGHFMAGRSYCFNTFIDVPLERATLLHLLYNLRCLA